VSRAYYVPVRGWSSLDFVDPHGGGLVPGLREDGIVGD
jgi:hypothetical protein